MCWPTVYYLQAGHGEWGEGGGGEEDRCTSWMGRRAGARHGKGKKAGGQMDE